MNRHPKTRKRTIKPACERLDDRTVPAAFNPLLGAAGAAVPFAVQNPAASAAADNINQPQSPFPSSGGAYGVYFAPGGTGGLILRSFPSPTSPVQNATPTAAAPTAAAPATPSALNAINDINTPQTPFPVAGGAHGVYFAPTPGNSLILRGGLNFSTNPSAATPAQTNLGAAYSASTSAQQSAALNGGGQNLFGQRGLQQFQLSNLPFGVAPTAFTQTQSLPAQPFHVPNSVFGNVNQNLFAQRGLSRFQVSGVPFGVTSTTITQPRAPVTQPFGLQSTVPGLSGQNLFAQRGLQQTLFPITQFGVNSTAITQPQTSPTQPFNVQTNTFTNGGQNLFNTGQNLFVQRNVEPLRLINSPFGAASTSIVQPQFLAAQQPNLRNTVLPTVNPFLATQRSFQTSQLFSVPTNLNSSLVNSVFQQRNLQQAQNFNLQNNTLGNGSQSLFAQRAFLQSQLYS